MTVTLQNATYDALVAARLAPFPVWLVFTDRNLLVGAFASDTSAVRYQGAPSEQARSHVVKVEVLP